MDEMFARLNRIYPNSGYVRIPRYNPQQWETREYDSKNNVLRMVNVLVGLYQKEWLL